MSQTTPHHHVLAAVIQDEAGRILIAQRPAHRPHGGLWEFPGGKRHSDESRWGALCRELNEELGIVPEAARPLITVPHHYARHQVTLDVWRVQRYRGTASGREGQTIQWVAPSALTEYEFPAANYPVITAARLPDRYLITPEPACRSTFLSTLEARLAEGIRLVQFRAKTLDHGAYRQLAADIARLCHNYNATWLANSAPSVALDLDADGVHLSAARLLELKQRPLSDDYWVAASCHNVTELRHAERVGVDFAVLSPVNPTPSHPDSRPLGWDRFVALSRTTRLPVFALGGVNAGDLQRAWDHGAQGVAGISGLWGDTAVRDAP